MCNGRILYALPSSFNWEPDFNIYKAGRVYSSDYDFEGNRPQGLAVYVDFQGGNDANDGLSESAPLRNFDTAVAVPGVQEIYIKRGGVGTRGQISTGTDIFAQDTYIGTYGTGANPRLTSGEDNPSWTQNVTYSQIWQTTRSGTDDVFDFSDDNTYDNVYGYHSPLALQASIEDVAANPGSYYIDAGNIVYVHTYDAREPDSDICVALNVPGIDCRSDIDLFIEGIDVYGFDFNLAYNQTTGTKTIAAKDCKFIRSPNGDALFIRNAGFAIFQNVLVAEAHEDGISYKTSTTQTRFLEENCICIRCGVAQSGNDNGSSSHDGVDGIRLNGIYAYNNGPNVADTNTGTQTICLGSHAFSSTLSNGSEDDADFWCNDGEMWLQDCSSAGSTSFYGRSQVGTSTLVDIGGYIDGVGQDNGTITSGGLSAFSPIDVSGLVAWYDADDSETITVDGANNVLQWDDKSGSENHLTQATASLQPTTGARTINGKNALLFNSDSMRNLTLSAPQPNAIFVVIEADTTPTSQYIFDGATSANRNTLYTSLNNFHLLSSGIYDTGVQMNTGVQLLSVSFNGVSSELRLNGVTIYSGNAGTTNMIGITVGARFSDGSFLDGAIAEVIIYDNLISSEDYESVGSYLANKWGLSWG